MKLTDNFDSTEFACPHCGQVEMDETFIAKLDRARTVAMIPFHINSGFRCPEHNKAVGGKPGSAHLTGHAADIKALTSSDRYQIINSLYLVGFNRIGVGKGFIHVDDDPDKPPFLMWDYYSS